MFVRTATSMIPSVNLRELFGSDLGRKTGVYFAALLLNAVLGIVVYGMLTRSMEVSSFGTYSFVIAFFAFTSMFFDFGVAPAGMRLLALLRDGDDHSRRIGAMFVLSAVIGVLYMLIVAAASLVVSAIFDPQAGAILLATAPLAAVYPLQEMVFSISQGSNRMRLMSVFLLLPRLLLIALLGAALLAGGVDARMAVLLTLAAIGMAVGMAAGYLRPSFAGLGPEIRAIFREVREYGREVYAGRLVDGLTNGLDKILISYFHGMAPVAYYTLSMTMGTPISMFSKAVAQSAYKRFVSDDRIARRILTINFLWCTAGALLLLAACQFLIPLLFTDRYAESLAVLPWIVAGFALAGLNHPFHSFLAAHRQGRAIRVMSMTSSGVNVAANLALVPPFGMTGAGIAFVATYAVNILMNLHYYRALRDGTASVPTEKEKG